MLENVKNGVHISYKVELNDRCPNEALLFPCFWRISKLKISVPKVSTTETDLRDKAHSLFNVVDFPNVAKQKMSLRAKGDQRGLSSTTFALS